MWNYLILLITSDKFRSIYNMWKCQERYMSLDFTIDSMLCIDVNMFFPFLLYLMLLRLICQKKSFKLCLRYQKKHSLSYQDGSKICWKEKLICSRQSTQYAAYAHLSIPFLSCLEMQLSVEWCGFFLVYTILGFLCISLWFWPIMDVAVVSVEIDL